MNGHDTYRELLTGMLAIPAPSGEERQRADFLQQYLESCGMKVFRQQNNLLVGGRDIQAGRGEEDAGRTEKYDSRLRILMNSHLDTVSPVAGWERDPFQPLVTAERITGLGSNDAGASVVTMIATYQELAAELEEQVEILLLISAEEEISGPGGISAVLPLLGHLDGGIVGEPTGMQPAVAERGLMVLDGLVRGKAGHAARGEGDNAIYRAMEDIRAIANLDFERKSRWLPDPGAQVTMISAGTNHNVVPDLCRYVVDVRSNDRYTNHEMLEMIRSVCTAELTPRSTRLEPSSIDPGHFLMKAVHECGLRPYGSSTLSDMALIPCPCVKMGPGDPGRSHTSGEFILISELEAGIKGYSELLRRIAGMCRNGKK
jgi:acetylornithine deacetylase